MNSKLDALLKITLVVSVLFASSAVGYYYLFYLPDRDARLEAKHSQEADDEKRSQLETQAALIRAQEEQQEAQRRAQEDREEAERQRQLLEKASVQARYDSCIRIARVNYAGNWASACKRKREIALELKSHCTLDANLQKTVCDPKKLPDPTDCALPREFANDFNSGLEKAKDHCLQETRAGLQ